MTKIWCSFVIYFCEGELCWGINAELQILWLVESAWHAKPNSVVFSRVYVWKTEVTHEESFQRRAAQVQHMKMIERESIKTPCACTEQMPWYKHAHAQCKLVHDQHIYTQNLLTVTQEETRPQWLSYC